MISFVLFKMLKLSPEGSKIDMICIIDHIVILALICISYTRKLVILETLRLVKYFDLKIMRKIKNLYKNN